METYNGNMIQRISDSETNISEIYIPSKKLIVATLNDKTYGINLINHVNVYPVDENNIKVVEIFTTDIFDKKIKVTQQVKVSITTRRVNIHVERRKKIAKFGLARNHMGPEPGVTITGEDISIITTFDKLDKKETSLKDAPKAGLVCRNCGEVNKHLTFKCPVKHLIQSIEKFESKELPPPPPKSNKNVYVPPHLKRNLNNDNDFGEMKRKDRENNIKLSNFSEDVTEDDLHDLLYNSGLDKPKRIFIVIDKKTKNSRGYAYISFYTKKESQEAIRVLNNKGFSYCILTATEAN